MFFVSVTPLSLTLLLALVRLCSQGRVVRVKGKRQSKNLHISWVLTFQMDFYISNWEKTQLLSTRAKVCVIHRRPGKEAWCNGQFSSPKLDQGSAGWGESGKRMWTKVPVCGLRSHLIPPLWGLSLGDRPDHFTFRKWEDVVLRYPFGTLRASQMCRWRQVRLRWWQGGSQWPALIILHSAHRGEGRQVRSEFSCMGEKVLDLQRATEMGVGRCLRLLFHAGVWGWETKDENAFGIWDFRPCSPLRWGIPQVYRLLLCLVIISTILLFSLLSVPTVFLEFKCISYWTLYSVKDYSLVPSQEEVIRSGLPCPDSSLFSIL